MDYNYPKIEMDEKEQNRRKFVRAFSGCLAGLVIIVIAVVLSGRAPGNFVPGTVVTVPVNASIREVATILAEANIIRSKALFQFSVKALYNNRPVIAGDFSFDQKRSVFEAARIITGGFFGKAQAKITIPEGSSAQDIARITQKVIPEWNGDEFMAKAVSSEGYLFPETYFMFKTITPDAVIDRLKKEYENRIASLRPEMIIAKRTESQIIIMASILEKEARNADEAKVVSGILWKRLDKGMPLQVDAPFLYTLGKESAELTSADLKKDGPYNTYTRKGLPKGPIGNPGLATISAAIHPSSSPYWFYLHDKNGVVHYAKTYEEHVQNKKKYLQ
jgi:UPF0755 protein